uniref:Cle7, putative n=1 Tax=Schistosoma mansoni TaxID=6183 RepID=A0A3Q0KHF3_SCHMA
MLANERLRFKLHSVNYPVHDVFDISDLTNVRNVIVWLEDRIIRALPAEARLRDVQSLEWTSYLNKYLQTVKCPFNESSCWAMLDWLLSKALLLEYNSSRNTQHNSISENSTLSTNAFNNIDVNSDEFKENVLKIAKLLQIPVHPDIRILFKAVCLVIEQKLEVNILNDAIKDYGTSKIDMLKLDDRLRLLR